MRTHDELLAEARRVGVIADAYADEHRRADLGGQTLRPRIIPTFVASSAQPRNRWVEAEMVDGALEYRLMEKGGATTDDDSAPVVRFASDSAFDLLVEEDELEERENFGAALAPILGRMERHEFDESIEPSVIEEVEALLDASELDPAARLKTKAEIVEFLAGRMEPSLFAAHVMERRTEREVVNESLVQRCDERRLHEHL